jgi:prepilin-type N-terminal cleavage/methylation domain-containing protein
VRRDRSGERGFTLLEILVAAVILSMVMTLAYGLFRWIQDASARVTEGRPRDRAVRVVLDRIERELSGAILLRRRDGVDPLAHPWVFYAEDHVLGDQEADRVRFVTQTPLRAAGELHGRGVRIVSYGLELGPDGLPMLLRSEEAMSDQLEKGIELSDAQVVAEDVAAFSLRYMGESGVRDTWDSTGVETDNLLPLNVEVMVQLWQHDAQGQLVPGTPVTRLVELPTRPEFLDPPGAAGAECETGMSTRDCREQWLAALQSEFPDDPARYQPVQEMFAQVSDACWAPEEESTQLRTVKQMLKTMGSVKVPECPVE